MHKNGVKSLNNASYGLKGISQRKGKRNDQKAQYIPCVCRNKNKCPFRIQWDSWQEYNNATLIASMNIQFSY